MIESKVLVVDDERHIRELLEMTLRKHAFDVRTASDGIAGLQLVREWSPDVVILDIMMPKLDGLGLLPVIRRYSEVPVLMLSAKGDVHDRVRGIEVGADDYISKPFEVVELIARIHASLRRPHLKTLEVLSYADLHVDLANHTVARGGRSILLTSREYNLLCVLLRNPGRVFSRDHLLDRVWGETEVTHGNVETYICYLRSKIDRPGVEPLLHTIRGAGYTLRKTHA